MLVVLGSRLAISCGLNHQSSSGSRRRFTCFLSKLSVGFAFSVDNGTLKYREPERSSGVKIFLLALDFKETISYLDRRLMNQVFLRELIQIVSINWRGHTVL